MPRRNEPTKVQPEPIVSREYDDDEDETLEASVLSNEESPPPPPKLQRETTRDYLPPLALPPLALPPRPSFPDESPAQPQPYSPTAMCTEFEKTCIFCKSQFYTDQDFKSACPDCYETNKRKCECGRNLPIEAPKFKTQGSRCWIESRKKTHETCPSCTGAKALHLRKRKDKPSCIDCFRHTRRDTRRDTHTQVTSRS
jgi:hypothetical protein